MNTDLPHHWSSTSEHFVNRHIGPSADDVETIMDVVGVESLDELVQQTIPDSIRSNAPLALPEGETEYEFLRRLKGIAAKNQLFASHIGMGYYGTIVPPVILRNVLENPGWYTQYTPYQAEIAQGRLESLVNFQTMVVDLTGMEIANASLLDEATAVAEAMHMMHLISKKGDAANVLFVDENVFPQTLDVVRTRALPLGIEIRVGNYTRLEFDDSIFGIVLQYPAGDGSVRDYRAICSKAHEHGAFVTVATDLLALAVLTPPGEFGADIAVGSSQRFGVPMGFGGPHAAFFATKDAYKRSIPGRIIGVSIDAQGKKAYRMALQTREQHIRRDKATSNICTAQALLANISAMYAVYHGPQGILAIAQRVHGFAVALASALTELGFQQSNKTFFDTLNIICEDAKLCQAIRTIALRERVNFRYVGDTEIGISLDETTSLDDVARVIKIFAEAKKQSFPKARLDEIVATCDVTYQKPFARQSAYLTHPVFNTHHSETEMLRYLKQLENKDFSLTHGMIPLGSCTMKLNATTEMIPVTWPEFGELHPFVPIEQAKGYSMIFDGLETALSAITGFPAVSLQPNAGAQGEYAGLLVIRKYQHARGEKQRDVVLIPASAHGTNPASAVMAGMKVVVTKTDEHGSIDVEDLRAKATEHKEHLAALMVTYPSTHGVFEATIREVCDIIHSCGGQVYMDGANLNAQVGLTSPAAIGADVCHLNLHKTFCIPHGGGGPGMGPIAVAKHLAPYLPTHPVITTGGQDGIGAISAAPWGSASILLISYAYICLMGGRGLTEATKMAILNANYLKSRLEPHYPILYTGDNGRVAHEMIVDMRAYKQIGIDVDDITKRLMDYGFHAPTVSFPVAGTLMVEPTESEPLAEMDRFCDALISIKKEIEEVESGVADKNDNALKHAPHTAEVCLAGEWTHSYSREKAAFPVRSLLQNKFWPSVGRVNNAFGDRTLICTCPPIEAYMEEPTLAG